MLPVLALQACSLLLQPPLPSRVHVQRATTAHMRISPPNGFEWGEQDRERVSDRALAAFDSLAVQRVVRLGNHAPAFASLSYFGLISMTMQSMQMPQMAVATLKSVITRAVGPTTNKAFSTLFATPVTPAGFVFLIWPVISALQLLMVSYSALRPGVPMTQAELTSLSLANVCATGWLLVSSNALAGALPVWSCLVLPLVPIFSGFPLRAASPPRGNYRLVFDVFSSFTTLASFLALAVELQYGGRVPFFAGRAELCSLIFVGLTSAIVALPRRTLVKKAVNLLALSGILWNRVTMGNRLVSLSFAATAACWAFAVKQLLLEK